MSGFTTDSYPKTSEVQRQLGKRRKIQALSSNLRSESEIDSNTENSPDTSVSRTTHLTPDAGKNGEENSSYDSLGDLRKNFIDKFRKSEFRDIAEVKCFDEDQFRELQAIIGCCEIQYQIARVEMNRNIGKQDFERFQERMCDWNERKWTALNHLNILNVSGAQLGEVKLVTKSAPNGASQHDSEQLDAEQLQKGQDVETDTDEKYLNVFAKAKGTVPNEEESRLLSVVKTRDFDVGKSQELLTLFEASSSTNEMTRKRFDKSIISLKNKKQIALEKLGINQYVTADADGQCLPAEPNQPVGVQDFELVVVKQEPCAGDGNEVSGASGSCNDQQAAEGVKQEIEMEEPLILEPENPLGDTDQEKEGTNQVVVEMGKLESEIKKQIDMVKETGSDKSSCYLCSKDFVTQEFCVQHIKMDHYSICPYCNYLAPGKEEVRRHINSKHEKSKEFFCYICKYSCSGRVAWNAHLKNYHRKIFKCQNCSKIFKRQLTLDSHSKTCNRSYVNEAASRNFSSGKLANSTYKSSKLAALYEASLKKSYQLWSEQSKNTNQHT